MLKQDKTTLVDNQEVFFNLNPVNFFIISGVIQNFILVGILFFRQGDRRLANRLLGLSIFIVNIHMSYLMMLDTNLDNLFSAILWFPYSFLTLIGPLILFYTKALTDREFSISRIRRAHFIPVLVEVLLQTIIIVQSILSNELVYNVPMYFYVVPLIYLWSAISIFYYLRLSISIIDKHEIWILKNFSNLKEITLVWLRKLIIYYRLLWLVWVPFAIMFLLFFRYQLQYLMVVMLLYILMLILIYLIFWIGIEGIMRSNLILIKDSKKNIANKNFSRYTPQEIRSYIAQINVLMNSDKLYLNEHLSLKELAAHLQADPNLISHILNTHVGSNFYDFINHHRVEEVKKKLKDPKYEHLSILGIALESGFNSKTTFNRVFKQVTGYTPTQYQKKF